MSEDTRITREPSLSVAGAYVRATGAGTAVGSAGRWSSSDFTSTQNVRFGSSSHCWPSSSGRRPSLYAPGTGGASTLNRSEERRVGKEQRTRGGVRRRG